MSMFQVEKPEVQKYLDYVTTRGNKGKRSIEILSRTAHFVDAINTEVGFSVLTDLCDLHESTLNKIAKLDATEQDKITFQVTEWLIHRWAAMVAEHKEILEKIKK